MIVQGDAGEGAAGFPLAAGGNNEQLVRRQIAGLTGVDEDVVRHLQVAELAGDGDVGHHAATDDQNLASRGHGGVGHLLNAVDVGGKGGDQHLARAFWHDLLQGLAHGALRQGVSLSFHVGGVGQQQQDALLPIGSQAAQIGRLAVDGGQIQLEITRMDEKAGRRANGEADAIDDGVGDPEGFDV